MTTKRKLKRRDKFRKTLRITSGTEMAMPREVDVEIEERKDAENGK
jgi:hypothetical protein